MPFWLVFALPLALGRIGSAPHHSFTQSVIHLVAWPPRSRSAAFDCFFGAGAISDLTCFDLHASRRRDELAWSLGAGQLPECPGGYLQFESDCLQVGQEIFRELAAP